MHAGNTGMRPSRVPHQWAATSCRDTNAPNFTEENCLKIRLVFLRSLPKLRRPSDLSPVSPKESCQTYQRGAGGGFAGEKVDIGKHLHVLEVHARYRHVNAHEAACQRRGQYREHARDEQPSHAVGGGGSGQHGQPTGLDFERGDACEVTM